MTLRKFITLLIKTDKHERRLDYNETMIDFVFFPFFIEGRRKVAIEKGEHLR